MGSEVRAAIAINSRDGEGRVDYVTSDFALYCCYMFLRNVNDLHFDLSIGLSGSRQVH